MTEAYEQLLSKINRVGSPTPSPTEETGLDSAMLGSNNEEPKPFAMRGIPEEIRSKVEARMQLLYPPSQEPSIQPEERGFFGNIKESFIRGAESSDISTRSFEAMIGLRDWTDVKDIRDAFIKEQVQDPIETDNYISKSINVLANMLPAMGKSIVQGAIGAGVGSVVPVLGTSAGFTAGNAQYWYRLGAGETYGTLMDAGHDEALAKKIGAAAGIVYAATGSIQSTLPVNAILGKGVNRVIAKSMQEAALRFAVKTGGIVVTEAAMEGVEEFSDIMSERMANNFEGLAKENPEWSEEVGRIWVTFRDSLLPMAMLIGATSIGNVRREYRRTRHYMAENAKIEPAEAADLVNRGKIRIADIEGMSEDVRRNSPELMEEYLTIKNNADNPAVLRDFLERGDTEEVHLGRVLDNLEKVSGRRVAVDEFEIIHRELTPEEMSPKRQEQLALGTKFMKNLDREVTVLKPLTENADNAFNGATSRGNTIYVSTTANNPFLQILLHELSDSLKQTNPELFGRLGKAIFESMKDPDSFMRYSEAAKKALGVTEANYPLAEEMISNAVGEMGMTRDLWLDLARYYPKGEFAKDAMAILRHLDSLVGEAIGDGVVSINQIQPHDQVLKYLEPVLRVQKELAEAIMEINAEFKGTPKLEHYIQMYGRMYSEEEKSQMGGIPDELIASKVWKPFEEGKRVTGIKFKKERKLLEHKDKMDIVLEEMDKRKKLKAQILAEKDAQKKASFIEVNKSEAVKVIDKSEKRIAASIAKKVKDFLGIPASKEVAEATEAMVKIKAVKDMLMKGADTSNKALEAVKDDVARTLAELHKTDFNLKFLSQEDRASVDRLKLNRGSWVRAHNKSALDKTIYIRPDKENTIDSATFKDWESSFLEAYKFLSRFYGGILYLPHKIFLIADSKWSQEGINKALGMEYMTKKEKIDDYLGFYLSGAGAMNTVLIRATDEGTHFYLDEKVLDVLDPYKDKEVVFEYERFVRILNSIYIIHHENLHAKQFFRFGKAGFEEDIPRAEGYRASLLAANTISKATKIRLEEEVLNPEHAWFKGESNYKFFKRNFYDIPNFLNSMLSQMAINKTPLDFKSAFALKTPSAWTAEKLNEKIKSSEGYRKTEGVLRYIFDSLDTRRSWGRVVTEKAKQGAFRTGTAIMNLFSIGEAHETVVLGRGGILHRVVEILKEHPEDYNTKDFKGEHRVLGAASDKEVYNKSPEYVKRAADVLNTYFDAYKTKLIDAKIISQGFVERLGSEMRAEIAQLKKTGVDPADIAVKEAELDHLNNLKFTHIPTAYITSFLQEKDMGDHGLRLLTFLNRKKRETVSLMDVFEAYPELRDKVDLGDVMVSYARKVGRDLGLYNVVKEAEADGLAIYDPLKKDKKGRIISGERPPKGHSNYVRAKFSPALKGFWVHPILNEWIQSTTIMKDPGASVLYKGMALAKMAAFYNPFFLSMYNAMQLAVGVGGDVLFHPAAGVRSLKRAFQLGINDWRHTTPEYIKSGELGARSTPFPNPFQSLQYEKRWIASIDPEYKKYLNQIAGPLAKILRAKTVGGKASAAIHSVPEIVSNFYNTSWSTAWSLDGMFRQIMYRYLTERGFTPELSAKLTAEYQGNYASVPYKTRVELNKFFFTPTFKIAMGKLYYNMARDSSKQLASLFGKGQLTQEQSFNVHGAVGAALSLLAVDIFMTQALGFKADEWGRKYKKEIETEEGPKELVYTFSSPMDLLPKFGSRLRKSLFSPEIDNPLLTFFEKNRFELHPILNTLYDVAHNKKPEGGVIYDDFDSVISKGMKSMLYGTRNILGVTKLILRDEVDVESRKAAQNELGKALTMLATPFSFRYVRAGKDRRFAFKVKMVLSQLRESARLGRLTPKGIESYQNKIKQLEEEWKSGNI
jgi:hypothetical protein